MNSRRRVRPPLLTAILAGATAAITLTSCAGAARSSRGDLPPSLQRLVERAAADRTRAASPVAPRDWSAPGPWDDADAARRDPLAVTPLTDVVASLTTPSNAPAPRPTRPEAIKKYAAGRAAMLAGDGAAAVAEFSAAHQADPAAPEPLRDLAEAHLTRGEYVEAIRALERAHERDPTSLRVLEHLGRHALRSGDVQRAETLLIQAWSSLDDASDAAIRPIIAVELGRALAAAGRSLAAAQALMIAADAPDEIASPRWADYAALVRQRPEILRSAGDLFARAGRWSEARDAFDRAFSLAPDANWDAILERRVISSMRSGSTSGAILAVVESCLGRPLSAPAEERFRASPQTLEWIARLARAPGARSSLLRAIEDASRMLSEEHRSTCGEDIALATAAAQSRQAAINTLRSRWTAAPHDDRTLGALLSRAAESSPSAAAIEAGWAATSRPIDLPLIADSLLSALGSWTTARDALLDATRQQPSNANLQATLAQVILPVDPSEALRLASMAAGRLNGVSAPAAIQAESLALLGRHDEADAMLREWPAASREHRVAKARALTALGRTVDALETLEPDVGSDASSDLTTLLFAASLARDAGRTERAERILHRAIAAFPRSALAHEDLIDTLLSRRPQAREEIDVLAAQVRDAARALRDLAPWSAALQRLFARDLMAQQQWAEAVNRLRAVLSQRPEDRDALALLLAAARQAGSLDELEPWVSDVASRRPDRSMWLAAHAYILAEASRVTEAADLLHVALAERPHDDEVSRALEDLYRTRIGNTSRADDLAIARLRRSPQTPDVRAERAEVLLRARRTADARAEIDAILDGPSPDEPLTAKLVQLGLAASAAVESDRAASPDALAIVDALATRLPRIPEGLHRRRILALVRADADLDRIRAAADLAATQHPALAGDAYLFALDELMLARRLEDALALARAAASTPERARPSLYASWIVLAISTQNGSSAEEACRAAIASRRVPEVFNALHQIAPSLRTEAIHTPDELAFLVATAFGSMGRDDDADRLYTLALEHNPDHAWSNNNLGYRWLDRGERFPEAYWMIVRAHRDLPDEPAVIDSLGWARYRAGIYKDVQLPNGKLLEGAVTLLQRAVDAMADRPDPEVYEHLGDALYHADRPDDARRAWEQALALTRQFQAQAEAAPNISVRLIETLRARRERLHQRLDAIANGRVPPTTDPLADGQEPPRPPDRPAGPVS